MTGKSCPELSERAPARSEGAEGATIPHRAPSEPPCRALPVGLAALCLLIACSGGDALVERPPAPPSETSQTPASPSPTTPDSPSANDAQLLDLAGGPGFFCALRSDGVVLCWGSNTLGQSGQKFVSRSCDPVAVPLPGPATQLTTTSAGACALVDARLYCWGSPGAFRLDTPGPSPVTPEHFRVAAVNDGTGRLCLLTEQGAAYCAVRGAWKPLSIDNGRQIHGDGSTICVARRDGSVLCDGWAKWAPRDLKGKKPFAPPGADEFVATQVYASAYDVCVVGEEAEVACTNLRNAPNVAPNLTRVRALSIAGLRRVILDRNITCAINRSGMHCVDHPPQKLLSISDLRAAAAARSTRFRPAMGCIGQVAGWISCGRELRSLLNNEAALTRADSHERGVLAGFVTVQQFALPMGAPSTNSRQQCQGFDSDRDGVDDDNDECPSEAEELNGVDDADGCPDSPPALIEVDLVAGQIKLRQKIAFAIDKAVIKPESFPLLDQLALVLDTHTSVGDVLIEGHISYVREHYSRDLSKLRARAVRDYLADKGIDPARIEAIGFGDTRPIDTNETAEGRRNNRRIEIYFSMP